MDFYEKTLNSQLIYKGSILNVERLTVELQNGRIATRDIIRNPGASVIIPVTDDNKLVLVEQFRKPNEKVFLELPAGKLEHGEDPKLCAERELREETGYTAREYKKVAELNPAPAFADEVLHLFLATGLSKGVCEPDEDEFVKPVLYTFEQAIAMIIDGRITDGKTVAGILLAARLLEK